MSPPTNGNGQGEKHKPAEPGTGFTAPAPTEPPHNKDAPKQKLPPWKRLWNILPDWLKQGMREKRQWKNFIRAMIGLLCIMILMVVQPTLEHLGSATFFGVIAMCICAPSMPMAIYMFLILTMCLGMCLGWAWGAAAWAAGLHVRSQARLDRQIQEQNFDPTKPMKEQFTKAIYQAKFLDPRSSAVTGAFVFTGTYFLGLMRACKPKLAFASIFGTIVFDMMTTFGPLFPMPAYVSCKALMVPAAAAGAIGICCTVFFFPETLSHMVLHNTVRHGVGTIQGLLDMQDVVLKTNPLDDKAWSELAIKAAKLRKSFANAAGGMAAMAKMLQLEISRGRISPDELGQLITKTRELGARAFGLASFVIMVEERRLGLKRYQDNPLPHHTSRTRKLAEESVKAELDSGHALTDLLADVDASTVELRQACQHALNGAAAWLKTMNETRWKKFPPGFPTLADRDEARLNLVSALHDYRTNKHFLILGQFKDMFDDKGELIAGAPGVMDGRVRGLFRCFIFTTALISFSGALIEYLEYVRLIEVSNPKNKLQYPTVFVQAVLNNANDSTYGEGRFDAAIKDPLADNEHQEINDSDNHDTDADSDDGKAIAAKRKEKRKNKKRHKYPRNPDARDPKNNFQRFGRFSARMVKALGSANGMFALRYGLVSIALWSIAVAPSSGKFFFENRGLWGLIMSQTGLGFLAGEQLYNVLTRVGGTCIGVVTGMVIWYIGAGHGHGNSYGIVIATMVFMIPFMFCRVVAPFETMPFWILTCVSVVFAVGYSWCDGNINQSANQGIGADLAGRRALLVIIGFTAGMLAATIPKPVSAKHLVREGVSKNIAAIGELYGLEVTAFERSRDDPTNIDREERRSRYRDKFLAIFGRFGTIEGHIKYAKLEPDFQGQWPRKAYEDMVKVQASILSASATLSGAYSQLDTVWIKRLTDRTEVLHPTFVADCLSLFAILRTALRHKVPLPPTIPIFERLAFYRRTKTARFVVSRYAKWKAGDKSAFGAPDTTDDGDDADDADTTGSRTPSQPSTPAAHSHGAPPGFVPGLQSPVPGSHPNAPRVGADGDTADAADSKSPENKDRILLSADKALWDALQDTMTWQLAHDEQFAISVTAVISLIHIVGGLNTMHSIVLDLVGERELQGFDIAHERWAAMETV